VITKESLRRAKRVADRESEEWKQRKWYDLYFEADKAYDNLDGFQTQYSYGPPSSDYAEWSMYVGERNQLMFLLRRVHSMAAVFPMNPIAERLF
jgi:hypothetical protein